jgi:hypothetical protein
VASSHFLRDLVDEYLRVYHDATSSNPLPPAISAKQVSHSVTSIGVLVLECRGCPLHEPLRLLRQISVPCSNLLLDRLVGTEFRRYTNTSPRFKSGSTRQHVSDPLNSLYVLRCTLRNACIFISTRVTLQRCHQTPFPTTVPALSQHLSSVVGPCTRYPSTILQPIPTSDN